MTLEGRKRTLGPLVGAAAAVLAAAAVVVEVEVEEKGINKEEEGDAGSQEVLKLKWPIIIVAITMGEVVGGSCGKGGRGRCCDNMLVLKMVLVAW